MRTSSLHGSRSSHWDLGTERKKKASSPRSALGTIGRLVPGLLAVVTRGRERAAGPS